MDKIWIQDSEHGHLSFDIKDVLEVIGQHALEAFWTAGPVEAHNESLDAFGTNEAHLETLARSGRRVSGYELRQIAEGIRQTIWGQFNGYENETAVTPWIIVIAVDSTWFEVHSTDPAVLNSLKATFKQTAPPTWSKARAP